MQIKIKKLRPDAITPNYAHHDDAGLDFFAIEEVIIEAGQIVQFPTGIAMEIPEGHVGLIWDKSGLSHNHGLKTLGGVLDSSYRGEIKIGIINLGKESYTVGKGHKIAQMIIQQKVTAEIIEVSDLDNNEKSERGEDGLGSTGK
jgi:dUTP pyrophosphatase